MRKYSDKFLNQAGILKHAVIGFEFEFYLKDLSFYKTLELMNQEFSPIKVWGFRQYHSDFTPDAKNFKIEPDLSGGSNMVELVTGPMDFYNSKYFLIKIIKFIQTHGYTNEKASIHFNISFDNKNLNDLNVLKLILNIDEDEIYRHYPTRKDNVYAKSIKKIVPFKEYDFFNIPIGVIKNNLRLPNDKYFGINFLHTNDDKEHQRIEYRYIGGKDYELNLGQLIYFMERFIILTYSCIEQDFNHSDINKLEDYLEKNISYFKNLSKYDNFIVEFPTIQIQIDQNSNYDVINSYYSKIYSKIFNLIENTQDLKECIINYVTTTQTLEIVDAKIKSTSTLRGLELVNCEAEGLFEDCFFLSSTANKSQLTKCKLQHSEITDSKIFNCKVEASTLKNCYFMDGYLNGDMFAGVYRSGKLGPYATMDSEVKVVTDRDNFFDTKFEEEDKSDKEGQIKGWGKTIK